MNIKYVLSVIFFVTFAFSNVIAQKPPLPKGERIEAYRAAYITKALNLSPEESQKFWPVYNEYRDSERALRKRKRALRKTDLEAASEKELETMMEEYIVIQEESAALQRTYFYKFKEIIGVRKVVELKKAEREFNKELLRLKKEREGKRRN